MMLIIKLSFFVIINSKIFGNCEGSKILYPLEPSEIYTHHDSVFDSDPSQYHVYWKILSNDQIQFEVHVKTLGWVGLGVSTNGGMKGSDIVIGWYDTSGPHLMVN